MTTKIELRHSQNFFSTGLISHDNGYPTLSCKAWNGRVLLFFFNKVLGDPECTNYWCRNTTVCKYLQGNVCVFLIGWSGLEDIFQISKQMKWQQLAQHSSEAMTNWPGCVFRKMYHASSWSQRCIFVGILLKILYDLSITSDIIIVTRWRLCRNHEEAGLHSACSHLDGVQNHLSLASSCILLGARDWVIKNMILQYRIPQSKDHIFITWPLHLKRGNSGFGGNKKIGMGTARTASEHYPKGA